MSTKSTKLMRTAGLAAALAVVPGIAAGAQARGDDDEENRLVGRAVLDVNTYAPGPTSGNFYTGPANGITFPTPSQPVEGFSAIVEGRVDGEYLAMPDNGFGGKAASPDFLIRAYWIHPDFKTAAGGSGEVNPDLENFVQFSDPDRLIGFPIVMENTTARLLTGGDIDPESLQVDRHGDLWVGDEFGPWILHFDAEGRLLEAPISLPGNLMSPNNPHLRGARPSQPNSRGLEGMGIDGRFLYPTLEGATQAELDVNATSTRRLMFEYDINKGAFTGRQWVYRVQPETPFLADIAPLDNKRLVVVERDGAPPPGAFGVHRRVYVVDLRHAKSGDELQKREVLNLAAIPDPDLVSLPAIHTGDVGLGDPFRVACESVEAIRVLSRDQVLVGCDNNFPNMGRNPGLADDNEFIVVDVPDLSDRR
jgi:hypothetical protein